MLAELKTLKMRLRGAWVLGIALSLACIPPAQAYSDDMARVVQLDPLYWSHATNGGGSRKVVFIPHLRTIDRAGGSMLCANWPRVFDSLNLVLNDLRDGPIGRKEIAWAEHRAVTVINDRFQGAVVDKIRLELQSFDGDAVPQRDRGCRYLTDNS